jgi:hypothetical protein
MKCICFILICCIACKNSHQPHIKNYINDTSRTEIRFITRIVSFGIVPRDTLLTAKYPFINVGTNKLVIKYVSPDCLCTGVYVNKKVILPKDTGFILLKFSTKYKSGEEKIYATVCANTTSKLYGLELVANIK